MDPESIGHHDQPMPPTVWPNVGARAMSGGIRVLSAAVASRIAAGEVVERPGSVVKELVENALDAGARTVRIDVRGGGLELIRVADDGGGIPADHLWLACQRHATSKMPNNDLDAVRTLGFRGEALPSIAAVSELTIVSADDDSGVGRRLTVRDGRPVVDQVAPRPRGTTVSVRSLFANMPARRSAVARVQTEVAQIGQIARRLALSAPDVRIALFTEDRLVFQTTGSGDHGAALVEVHGAGVGGALAPLPTVEVAGATLCGVVVGADVTLPSRAGVHLLINRRWVQPRGFVQIVENAYRPVVPRGRHPILLVSVETPPNLLDVNIHPAKLEVRLHAERMIATEAGRLIKETLGRRPAALGFRPLTGLAAIEPPESVEQRRLAEASPAYDAAQPIVTPGLPTLTLKGQIQNRLILLEGEAGVYLVDQHRAHERILYERLARTHGPSAPESVPLPEPLLIELRPAQIARFGHRLDELTDLGFELESFGGRAFLLRAAPSLPGVTTGDDPLAGLGDADELGATLLAAADEIPSDAETWRDRLLVRLSCRTAVRRGRPLDHASMRTLVEQLGHTPAPAVCPHGSPLLMHVSGSLLAKEFDWT